MNQHDQIRKILEEIANTVEEPLWYQALAEQALAHVNETPKTEHVSDDVLQKPGNVDMTREALSRLYSVVIAKNRAGADWGDQFGDLMVALALADQALADEPEPEIADARRTLSKWLNEEIDAPIDRYALAKVLAATQRAAKPEPKKLVRLTDDELKEMFDYEYQEEYEQAYAIMDAMERKNGGAA